MKIIKRNGSEADFDDSKIYNAIKKANEAADESVRMTDIQISRITERVVLSCEELGRSPSVEEVQDMVEHQIMAHGA
ncbi:MAG: anaerobic ribonucleoside-triphosphate reductase, partial [Ruminococcaceae bacterium]|nr:anaerobic ribonucleoside-triphosphate reductase [Oscillospiraceae bacterium]